VRFHQQLPQTVPVALSLPLDRLYVKRRPGGTNTSAKHETVYRSQPAGIPHGGWQPGLGGERGDDETVLEQESGLLAGVLIVATQEGKGCRWCGDVLEDSDDAAIKAW
jgi:hypothetical protein